MADTLQYDPRDPTRALRSNRLFWEHFNDTNLLELVQNDKTGNLIRQLKHPNQPNWHFRVLTPFLKCNWMGVFPRGYSPDHYPIRPGSQHNYQREAPETEYSGILEGAPTTPFLVDDKTQLDLNFVRFTEWLNRVLQVVHEAAPKHKKTKDVIVKAARTKVLEGIKARASTLAEFDNPAEAPATIQKAGRFMALEEKDSRTPKEEEELKQLYTEVGADEAGILKHFAVQGAKKPVYMSKNKDAPGFKPGSQHLRLGGKVFKQWYKDAKDKAEARGQLVLPEDPVLEHMANFTDEKKQVFYGYGFNECTMSLIKGPNGEANTPVPYDHRKTMLTNGSVAAWEIIISPKVSTKTGLVSLLLEPRHCHLLHRVPPGEGSEDKQIQEEVPGAVAIEAPWTYGKAPKVRSPVREEPYHRSPLVQPEQLPPRVSWTDEAPPVISPSEEFDE